MNWQRCLWGLVAGGLISGLADEPDEKPKVSPWQKVINVRPMIGYDDNVGLSSFDEQGSGFVGGELDFLAWRPLGERSSFQGFLSGEHRQYWDAPEVRRADSVFLMTEFTHEWGEDWETSEGLDYFYINEVMDVSATQDVPAQTRVVGNSLVARPSGRHQTEHGWIQFDVAGSRQWLAAPLDDYWQIAPKIAWEWPVIDEAEVVLSYEFSDSWYDNDLALDQDGDPIPGTERENRQHTFELSSRQYYGRQDQWRLTVGVSTRLNVDPAEGYYDYLRPSGTVGLRYREGPWQASTRVRFSYYGYSTQTVSDTDPALRQRGEFKWEFQAHRQVAKFLKVFVAYYYTQTYSNRENEQYHVNQLMSGLDFEF